MLQNQGGSRSECHVLQVTDKNAVKGGSEHVGWMGVAAEV